MINELNIWAAQGALLGALGAQAAYDVGGPAEVAIDLGFPTDIQAEHVWIDGGGSGKLNAELTGSTAPSAETFRFKVFIYTQAAADYATVRARLKTLAGAAEAALASAAFLAVVPAWSVPEYVLDEGTDGTTRQLALQLTVECRCW